MQILAIDACAFDVPMRAPYRSARRVTTTARNVLVRVTLADGTVGFGESAPATYVTGETQESVLACLRRIDLSAVNASGAVEEFLRANERTISVGARSALLVAALDAQARVLGVPFYALLGTHGPPVTQRVTDLSLPILLSAEAAVRAAEAARDGFACLKIKVGGTDRTEDISRVRTVAAAAPHATLRLDGNQGFTGEAAVSFLDELADLQTRIELFEQPTPAGDEVAMAFVSARTATPVFADESVHGPEDARRLIAGRVCRGVVLKLAKSDPLTIMDIGRAVHDAGGVCLFGCMMETRLAVTAALHIAVALGPEIVPMLDLDGHLLVDDAALIEGGLAQRGDMLSIDPTRAGLGARPIRFLALRQAVEA